jgi:hypothetical protein
MPTTKLYFVGLNDLPAFLTLTDVAKSVVAPQSDSKIVAIIRPEEDVASLSTLCEQGEQDIKWTSAKTGPTFVKPRRNILIGHWYRLQSPTTVAAPL